MARVPDPMKDPMKDTVKTVAVERQPTERQVASEITDVCAGGGGRFLFLFLPREKKLAVFDAEAGQVIKYLPTVEDNVRFAAGQDVLVLYLPERNEFQRWSLKTLEREAAEPSPFKGLTVVSLCMGSASATRTRAATSASSTR